MMTEIRLALRSLVKTPGFTVVAVITGALAIAANTAVFSLVNALLIRPLPFQKAAKSRPALREISPRKASTRSPSPRRSISITKKRLRSYERIAAFNFDDFNLTGGDMPERISGRGRHAEFVPAPRRAADQGSRLQRKANLAKATMAWS